MTDVGILPSRLKSMQEVNVCSFLNPSLFWIRAKNKKKEAEISHLESQFESIYQHQYPSSSSFVKGEVVVVKHEDKYMRGIVEDVIVTHTGSKVYSCWLMDYGKLLDSDLVFKYNNTYDIPPFAKQASLFNITFLEQKMDVSTNHIELQKVKESTAAVQLLIEEKISNNDNLIFLTEHEALDIVFGDIMYSEDGDFKSLRDTLIQLNLAVKDTNFIEDFDFKRFKDKTQYLSLLRHSRMNELENKKPVKKFNSQYDIAPDGMHPSLDILGLLGLDDQEYDDYEGSFRRSERALSSRYNTVKETTAEIVEQITKNYAEQRKKLEIVDDPMKNIIIDDKMKKINILLKRSRKSKSTAKTQLGKTGVPKSPNNKSCVKTQLGKTEVPKSPNNKSSDSLESPTTMKEVSSPENCRTLSYCSVKNPCMSTRLSNKLMFYRKSNSPIKSFRDCLNNESIDSITHLNRAKNIKSPKSSKPVTSSPMKSPEDSVVACNSKSPCNTYKGTTDDSSSSSANRSSLDNPSPVKPCNKQKLLDLLKKRSDKYVKHATKKRDPFESESDMEKAAYSSSSKNVGDSTTDNDDDTTKTSDTSQEMEYVPKHFANKNGIVFKPAGASYSLMNTKTSQNKRRSRNMLNHSAAKTEDEIFCSENSEIDQKKSEDTGDNETSEERCVEQTDDESCKRLEAGEMRLDVLCKCKDCDFWTNTEGWAIRDVSKKRHIRIDTNIKAPPLLRPADKDVGEVHVKAVKYNNLSKIEKLQVSKQIIHGYFIPRPLKALSEAPFSYEIHELLHKNQYNSCKRLQMYSIPAILNSMNTCLINGPKSGKTIGYLLPIASFLTEKGERYIHLYKYTGPIVVILCPNSKKCQDVYDIFKVIFFGAKHKPNIITATYPLHDLNLSSMDVLITTPLILAYLLKSNAVNLKRMCHLIFEDLDVIINKYKHIPQQILDVTQNMLDHRRCESGVQIITTSEQWDIQMENLLKKLNNLPLVCIGDSLEAALYGRTSIKLDLLERDAKPFKLMNILKDKYKVFRSVVICKNHEIETLVSHLRQQGIDVAPILDDMPKEEILCNEERWSSLVGGEYIVLVCTDNLLNTILTITTATLVVHYSFPETWTLFKKRFSCFVEMLQSPFASKEEKYSCESYILVDEDSFAQIPKLLCFLGRMKGNLTEAEVNTLNLAQAKQESEKAKKKIALCEHIIKLGPCSNSMCSKRHIIDENLDIIPSLPQNGKIRFRILKIEDLTQFRIKIIEHIDISGIQHKWSDLVPDCVDDKLTVIMSMKKTPVLDIVVGEWYACHLENRGKASYFRCEVYKLHPNNLVMVKMIDDGTYLQVEKHLLYELPEPFKSMPLKVVHARLADLVPPYFDEQFSTRAFKQMVELFEYLDYSNITFSADVYLQLGKILWLKNMMQEVIIGNDVVTKMHITKRLKDMKLAEVSEKPLRNLYNLCEEADIKLPKYVSSRPKAVKKHEEQVKPQWAFLDQDKCQEVTFSAAITPDEFYVKLNKFEDLLLHLQEEIQEIIKRPFYDRKLEVKIGKCYLAKDPKGTEYSRVMVLKIKEGKALCFFVDYGDEATIDVESLKYIPNHIITKLPFQSIRCRLYGLRPILDEWQEQATDLLYDYAFEPDCDIYRLLYVKTCVVEKLSLSRKKYAVILKDGYSKKGTVINTMMIDCGLAVGNSQEPIRDFEIPKTHYSDSDTDSDVEEALDILRKTSQLQDSLQSSKGPEIEMRSDVPGENEPNFDEMEIVIFDNAKFLQNIRELNENKEARRDTQLPPITASASVDYKTPDVFWSETETHIKMNIRVPNVDDQYTLKLVKGKLFHFKVDVQENRYILKLILFEPVETTYQHCLVGHEVRVTFKKTKAASWPRLISSAKSMRHIHFVFTGMEEEEKTRRFLDLGDISDDGGDTDKDDDVKYMEVTDSDSDFAEFLSDS